jgi:hypothetical protein
MDVSSASSQAASANVSLAVKARNETMDMQEKNAATLIESLPDPSSSVGQNINVRA